VGIPNNTLDIINLLVNWKVEQHWAWGGRGGWKQKRKNLCQPHWEFWSEDCSLQESYIGQKWPEPSATTCLVIVQGPYWQKHNLWPKFEECPEGTNYWRHKQVIKLLKTQGTAYHRSQESVEGVGWTITHRKLLGWWPFHLVTGAVGKKVFTL
jgi:hypothetical protein